MTEGNTSPVLDFPSSLPLCLPEVPAGIQRAMTLIHSFIHSLFAMMILSYARKQQRTGRPAPEKQKNILSWSLCLSSHVVEKTDKSISKI